MELPINQILQGDCLEVLKTFPDKSVDLVVTSPPYNMGGKSLGYQPRSSVADKHYDSYNDDISDEAYIIWSIHCIKECLRVSRYVFWNVQFVNSTRKAIIKIQDEFEPNLKEIFIWYKHAVSVINANKGGLAKGWEYVFMFGDNNLTTFTYNNFPENGYVPNRKEWYKSEIFNEHHATFPLELPRYFIQYFTKPDDIVLDPFMGVGTTAKAAKMEGRKYIGIEISSRYVEIAKQRVAQAPSPLFTDTKNGNMSVCPKPNNVKSADNLFDSTPIGKGDFAPENATSITDGEMKNAVNAENKQSIDFAPLYAEKNTGIGMIIKSSRKNITGIKNLKSLKSSEGSAKNVEIPT